MLATAEITEILWVAGGALLTAVLLIAVVLWITHERPPPDPTLGAFPVDELEPDDPRQRPPQRDD